jgi:two-component system phosphate regulon sensor histidine kinase PhoR
VLTSLLANAIKYSPAGGEIAITLEAGEAEAVLCVRDYGIGVPAEQRAHIFERAQRGTDVGTITGLGLGLFVSWQIVRAHEGRLWVSEIPGRPLPADRGTATPVDLQGSQFCLALPLAAPAV